MIKDKIISFFKMVGQLRRKNSYCKISLRGEVVGGRAEAMIHIFRIWIRLKDY